MCSGIGGCGTFEAVPWKTSPTQLSHQVGSLSTLPGVPDTAFKRVAAAWTASPPEFRGTPIALSEIGSFMEQLLSSDPFGMGDTCPYVDFKAPSQSKVVAVTQRQLAFVVANVLMGNKLNTTAATDGLSAAVARCSSRSPTTFLLSLLSLLAILSVELSRGGGSTALLDGTMLVAATPGVPNDAWKINLTTSTLKPPRVSVGGMAGSGSANSTLSDFMAGGTPFQALTDIAGGDVGGGAELCDVAFSQDESLVQYYSEVLAFAFFTTESNGMLPVPWTLLGARRYLANITGEVTSKADATCGTLAATNWLNSNIDSKTTTATRLSSSSKTFKVAASSFVAVASYCIDCHVDHTACPPAQLLNNECDFQRRHADEDLGLWLAAVRISLCFCSLFLSLPRHSAIVNELTNEMQFHVSISINSTLLQRTTLRSALHLGVSCGPLVSNSTRVCACAGFVTSSMQTGRIRTNQPQVFSHRFEVKLRSFTN